MRTDTKRKTDSKGMTLVELIVTFAVAAIFMTAAAMLVVPAMKLTVEVKGMNRVHDDAAIIMETIVNELSYAECYEDATGGTLTIQLVEPYPADSPYSGYYQKVKYNDKGGNPAVMSVTPEDDAGGKNRLLITYEAITETGAVEGENPERPEIEWSYGKGLYRDNEIMLGFQKKSDDKNIITVRLTVTNTTSGYTYTEEADVRCMNVEAVNITEP